MSTLTTPLKNIPRITPKYAEILKKINLHTAEDFLRYLPFRYDDFSEISPISPDIIGKMVTIEGRVTKKKLSRLFRRKMTIAEITLEDENRLPLKAVWFNQPFILESMPENAQIRLSGKITLKGKQLTMSAPAWERSARENTHTGCLVPIYSETEGLTSKWIRWQMKNLLPLLTQIPEIIPLEILKKIHLPSIQSALRQIHFPQSEEKLILARKRIAFEDMLLIQLKVLQTKKHWENNRALSIRFEKEQIKHFVSSLSFQLTGAQKKATFAILKDLEKNIPMNRLLNGDVGSGKTVVAAIAALQVASSGFQVAILAPTEVLARQHFESFCKLFEKHKLNIALLTNSYQEMRLNESESDALAPKSKRLRRDHLLRLLASGTLKIIIGTHALIQQDVRFKKLALAIIDEQHRFGVSQRAHLQQETAASNDGSKKTVPHLLTMTATPIPRTLSISLFGSLEISILDEMPKNRKSIITKIVPLSARKNVYIFIQKEIRKGRQIFIILPLVEESKALFEVKAAVSEHRRLSEEIFPDLKLGLLHGKMKASEKEKVMQDFQTRHYDILVATSVVEVGIDIPNASIILIEDADRFGLSQLHQFRGRVGRGEHQSYCFLLTNSSSDKSTERLKVLEETSDGFAISQKDLELRGPGQFFGNLQSGLPDIPMEHLGNLRLIKITRSEAQNILENDPELKKHPLLAVALQKFQEKVHLE